MSAVRKKTEKNDSAKERELKFWLIDTLTAKFPDPENQMSEYDKTPVLNLRKMIDQDYSWLLDVMENLGRSTRRTFWMAVISPNSRDPVRISIQNDSTRPRKIDGGLSPSEIERQISRTAVKIYALCVDLSEPGDHTGTAAELWDLCKTADKQKVSPWNLLHAAKALAAKRMTAEDAKRRFLKAPWDPDSRLRYSEK